MEPLLAALVQAGIMQTDEADRLERQLDSNLAREYAEQQMLLSWQAGLSGQRDRLVDAIRANDGVLSLTQQNRFWAGENTLLWNSVRETILDVASERAVVAAINAGGMEMWELINEEVIDYAENYYTSTAAANVGSIPNLNQTSRQRVGDAVAAWQRGTLAGAGLQDGLPQLIRSLEPTFGARRAKTIGITETTRIFTESIRAAEAANPFTTQWEWLTAADEMVCNLCGPRAGQRVTKNANGFGTETDALVGYPPIHVLCRCQIVALTDLAAQGVPEVVREPVTVTPVAAPVEFGKMPPVIGEVHPEVIQVFQEQFETLARDYPFLRDYVKGFDFTNPRTAAGIGGEWDNDDQTIRLASGMAKLSLREIENLIKSTQLVDGGTLRALVIHEAGHAIDSYVKFGVGRMSAIQDDYFDAIDALRQALPTPSVYGASNRSEWLAERFVHERLSRDNELQNVFTEFIPQVDERNLQPEQPTKRKGKR